MDINALNGPKMTEGQIQAYLARLGIFETVPRTLAGLGRIQLAHNIMVPFENLDIVAGRPLSLDLHHLYDKIVVRGQGGVCAELNTLYNWLLYSMGFAVTSYNARMLSPPPISSAATGSWRWSWRAKPTPPTWALPRRTPGSPWS